MTPKKITVKMTVLLAHKCKMGNPKEEAERTNLERLKNFKGTKSVLFRRPFCDKKCAQCIMHMLAAFDILTQFRFTFTM